MHSLKKAREDDEVKRLVLRVNSPGGSALAFPIYLAPKIEITRRLNQCCNRMGDVACFWGVTT